MLIRFLSCAWNSLCLLKFSMTKCPFVFLALFFFIQGGQSSTISYVISSDNDLAIFTGNSLATTLDEVVQKDTSWTVAETGSFTISSTEFVYVFASGFGGHNGLSGSLNTIELTTLAWEYADLDLSDFTGIPQGLTFPLPSNAHTLEHVLSINSRSWLTIITVP